MITVSPGVRFREIDASRYLPTLSTTILALVGTSPKGPVNVPTYISNVGALVSIFGGPAPDHAAMYSAAEFLRWGSQLYFIRVNGDAATTATVNMNGDATQAVVVGTLAAPYVLATGGVATVTGSNTSATVNVTSGNKKINVSIDGGPLVTITLIEGSGVAKATIAGEIDTALTAYGANCAVVGTNQISITSVSTGATAKVELFSITNNAYTLLGLALGAQYGTNNNKTLKVTSLDSTGPTTVVSSVTFTTGSRTAAQVVSDLNTQFATDSNPLVADVYNGTVRIKQQSYGQDFAFKLETTTPSVSEVGAMATLGFPTDGEYIYGRGISPAELTASISANSSGLWGNALKVVISNGFQANSFKVSVYLGTQLVEVYDSLVGNPADEVLPNKKYFQSAINGTGGNPISKYIVITDTETNSGFPVNGTYLLTGGDDGLEAITDADFIGTVTSQGKTGLQLLSSAEEFDINLMAVPGISSAPVIAEMLSICASRADCMCIIDPPLGLGVQQVVDWHNGSNVYGDHQAFNSSYGALYWPWVQIFDAASNRYVWTPPSGHAAAVYAFTDQNAEAWFAPAGFNRGKILVATKLEFSSSEGDRELLYGDGNAVNAIVKFRQDGIVIWGQRTLQREPTALDRVNVRRLLLYIRKVVTTGARYFVFEPNDPATWRSLVGTIDPFFRGLRSRRGVTAYQIICDETTNTPDHINNNEMVVKIFIDPVRAAEKILIDAIITPSGANFAEILY